MCACYLEKKRSAPRASGLRAGESKAGASDYLGDGAVFRISAAILPLFSHVARMPRRPLDHDGRGCEDSLSCKMFQIIRTKQFNNNYFNFCDLFLSVIGK